MHVYLGQNRVELSDSDELGAGGEARVFAWRDLALKIFHPADPAASRAERRAHQHALAIKARKLAAFPAGLPPEVVAPAGPVRDSHGLEIGYAMPRVENAEPLHRLSQRSFREGAIANAELCALFRALAGVLEALHRRSVVVGDLNDGNVLFRGARPFLIDVDSLQYGGWFCQVAHERFLDPRLYGKDLTARAELSAASDWYAFAVALFASLLYVHPFGGVHRALPTLLRRAEARHSILRGDVTLPKAAAPLAVLPDDLRAWFEAVFEKDHRGPPPKGALEPRWLRCACGLEHARASCPQCARPRPRPPPSTGRLRVAPLYAGGGRLLAVAFHGGPRWLALEGNRLVREDGAEVPHPRPGLDAVCAIAGSTTWIAEGRTALAYRGGAAVERAELGRFEGHPAFSASAAGAAFSRGDWLLDDRGGRLGRILESRTWLALGERFGLGLMRAGLCSFGFLFTPGRAGLREVALPAIPGRWIALSCVFDRAHALLSVLSEHQGRRFGTVQLIHESGQVLASRRGEADGDALLASVRGRALLEGRVVFASEDGLVAARPDASGGFDELARFPEAREWVGPDDALVALPSGELLAWGPKELLRLSLS